MKLFAIFAAILAVAMGAPTASWSISEVSAALQDPNTNPALIPYLEEALNEMMDALYAGYPAEFVQAAVPAVSTWTLQQLSAALEDPTTNPALIPYLEHALEEIMDALASGQQTEAIAVVVPAGIAPVGAEVPVVVVPGPQPVPSPVLIPRPEPLPASSSPLVQIIVKVAQPEQVSSPAAEIEPSPVMVVEQPEVPFNPVDVVQPGGVAVNPIVPGPVVGPMV